MTLLAHILLAVNHLKANLFYHRNCEANSSDGVLQASHTSQVSHLQCENHTSAVFVMHIRPNS